MFDDMHSLIGSTLKLIYVDLESLELIYTFETEDTTRKNVVFQFSPEYCNDFEVNEFSPSLTEMRECIVDEIKTQTEYSHAGIVESLVIKFLDYEVPLTALWTKESNKVYKRGCTIKDEIAF